MHDLPDTHGFMLIPGGIAQVDLRGQMMVHNAVAWFQRGSGVDLWFLSNRYDEKDMVNERQRRMFGDAAYAQFPELMPATYMLGSSSARPSPGRSAAPRRCPPRSSSRCRC